jgi:hypothetical protein
MTKIDVKSCFRCNGALKNVTPLDVVKFGAFYECEICESEYAKLGNNGLCDRWGMPLTIALYELICAANTEDKFDLILIKY